MGFYRFFKGGVDGGRRCRILGVMMLVSSSLLVNKTKFFNVRSFLGKCSVKERSYTWCNGVRLG